MKKKLLIFLLFCLVGFVIFKVSKKINLNWKYEVGEHLDSFNNVVVYYNGGVENTSGRNISPDKYNIGIKYQCVEFVKRYYYEHLNHKMPDASGNAKDFFDKSLSDGVLNTKRNLVQYTNGSKSKPKSDDLVVFSASTFNKYGHVAIISSVEADEIEIIQQNAGPFGKSRQKIKLKYIEGTWIIDNDRILGWLRKEQK